VKVRNSRLTKRTLTAFCEVGLPLERKKRTIEATDSRAESVLDAEGIDDKIQT
jgi:hypothetical protein